MDSAVIVDLKLRLSKVIIEKESILALAGVLSSERIHFRFNFTAHVHYDNLGVVTSTQRLKEWVICDLESNSVEVCELEMVQRHVLENDGVVLEDVVLIVSAFNCLTLYCLDVVLELFSLIILELSEVSFNEAKVLSGKWSDLNLHFGVKQELHCALMI